KLIEHQTETRLWKNLGEARLAGDSREVAVQEAALATFLTEKLEKIEGKPYRGGKSLADVLQGYESYLGRPNQKIRQRLFRVILFTAVLLPPVIFLVKYLRSRKGGEQPAPT